MVLNSAYYFVYFDKIFCHAGYNTLELAVPPVGVSAGIDRQITIQLFLYFRENREDSSNRSFHSRDRGARGEAAFNCS